MHSTATYFAKHFQCRLHKIVKLMYIGGNFKELSIAFQVYHLKTPMDSMTIQSPKTLLMHWNFPKITGNNNELEVNMFKVKLNSVLHVLITYHS